MNGEKEGERIGEGKEGWMEGRKKGRKGILEDLLARRNVFPNWNHFSCFIK